MVKGIVPLYEDDLIEEISMGCECDSSTCDSTEGGCMCDVEDGR